MREKELQVPSRAQPQPRYPKTSHSWGKNRPPSYVQPQIAGGHSHLSNNHHKSQELYNSLPRGGKPKSAYSYQRRPYHSQSLPRNAIPPNPDLVSHPPNGRDFQTMPRRGISATLISSTAHISTPKLPFAPNQNIYKSRYTWESLGE